MKDIICIKKGVFMEINIAQIVYKIVVIILIFAGALIITKMISKLVNKKK